MSFETFVETYRSSFSNNDEMTPEEIQDTLDIWDELLQLSKRLKMERKHWEDLEGLGLPEYATNEEWLEAAIKSGRTGKSAEELTTLVARLTEISEDFEAVMKRFKAVGNSSKKAQLRRTLSDVFPFAKEDDLTDIFPLKGNKVPEGSDDLKSS